MEAISTYFNSHVGIVSSFDKPAVNNVILVILILGWTGFARHARAETMSIKERQYVISASIMGLGTWKYLEDTFYQISFIP